jgi:outer membrane lipoprotein SlyB
MHRYLAVAAAIVIAGCASTSNDTNTTSTAQKPMEEKEYRVGSRIPVKDASAASASRTGTVDPAAMRSGTPTRTN